MENLEFDLDETFQEIRSRGQSQGALTKEEYLDLVEEVLEEKREEGLLDEDFNYKQAQEALEARWPELADSETEEPIDDMGGGDVSHKKKTYNEDGYDE